MKIEIKRHPLIFLCLFIFSDSVISVSCSNHRRKNNTVTLLNENQVYKKPVSTYQDSLIIETPAAIFYHPDSLQLLKIAAGMDSSLYDGTMHEFYYQIRNAKMILEKNWPAIRIIEAKNYRYLLFKKSNDKDELIDLDTKNDAYGLFLFDKKKSPQLVDMTNIETALSNYFR